MQERTVLPKEINQIPKHSHRGLRWHENQDTLKLSSAVYKAQAFTNSSPLFSIAQNNYLFC